MVVFSFNDNRNYLEMWSDPNNNTRKYFIHPDNTAEYWEYED
jgi:hypothetical protein